MEWMSTTSLSRVFSFLSLSSSSRLLSSSSAICSCVMPPGAALDTRRTFSASSLSAASVCFSLSTISAWIFSKAARARVNSS